MSAVEPGRVVTPQADDGPPCTGCGQPVLLDQDCRKHPDGSWTHYRCTSGRGLTPHEDGCECIDMRDPCAGAPGDPPPPPPPVAGRGITPDHDGWTRHPDVTDDLAALLDGIRADLAICVDDHYDDERLARAEGSIRWLLGMRK